MPPFFSSSAPLLLLPHPSSACSPYFSSGRYGAICESKERIDGVRSVSRWPLPFFCSQTLLSEPASYYNTASHRISRHLGRKCEAFLRESAFIGCRQRPSAALIGCRTK